VGPNAQSRSIYAEAKLPAHESDFGLANSEFFGPAVTGWGSPGGADARRVSDLDHTLVTARAKTPADGVR
jgi:hypothetical protein